VRVLIADDHELFRQGLRLAIVDALADAEIVEAGDLATTHAALAAAPVALALIDLDMPGVNGAASLRALREAFPQTCLAVVSASSSREDVLAALQAGAHGYLSKMLRADLLIDEIRAVLAGHVRVPPALAEIPLRTQEPVHADQTLPQLSPRQQDVARGLAKGLPTRDIAHELGLSQSTVKVHLAAVYRAVGARSRAEAVVKVARLLAEGS
jgi:DNA-binding NarL/FixJ family response regulator